jgi:hypothetical protein
MSDELATILRLVAEGTLTPEEAGPIIDALRVGATARAASAPVAAPTSEAPPAPPVPPSGSNARHIRIRVNERGRQVVNLRIPIGLADAAVRMVPGISPNHGEQIRAAIGTGEIGPIVDIEDEDGSGVLISME